MGWIVYKLALQFNSTGVVAKDSPGIVESTNNPSRKLFKEIYKIDMFDTLIHL